MIKWFYSQKHNKSSRFFPWRVFSCSAFMIRHFLGKRIQESQINAFRFRLISIVFLNLTWVRLIHFFIYWYRIHITFFTFFFLLLFSFYFSSNWIHDSFNLLLDLCDSFRRKFSLSLSLFIFLFLNFFTAFIALLIFVINSHEWIHNIMQFYYPLFSLFLPLFFFLLRQLFCLFFY